MALRNKLIAEFQIELIPMLEEFKNDAIKEFGYHGGIKKRLTQLITQHLKKRGLFKEEWESLIIK